jgi:zinc-finger-containing domain
MTPICPYCQSPAEQCTGADVYDNPAHAQKILWRCRPCKAWVGCHPGTDVPLGRLANETLRKAKRRAHEAFDALWKPGTKQRCQTRDRAYYWLSQRLRIKRAECHIGMFDVDTCNRVVAACKEAHGPNVVSLHT